VPGIEGRNMAIRPFSAFFRVIPIALAGMALAACQESDLPKQLKPVPYVLTAKMDQLSMKATSPILIRIFKESSELEVWKAQADGKYALLKTYAVCKWSGELGPKKVEGDRQAPEGFYTVTPAQMNPESNYYLSFNVGYPNAFDRAYGRTGSNLMVHGACSSSGCYSMTDEDAGELFALARDAFRGGQTAFQIQAFPFRMTPENLAKHRDDPNMPFWRMLKVGYDHFEVTRNVPKVDVCNKQYVFDADAGDATFNPVAACPAYQVPSWIATAAAAKAAADDRRYAQLTGGVAVADATTAPPAAPASAPAPSLSLQAAAVATPWPPMVNPWLPKPAVASGPATPVTAAMLREPVVLVPSVAPARHIAAKPPAPRKKPVVEAKAVVESSPEPKPSSDAKVEATAPAPVEEEAKAPTPPEPAPDLTPKPDASATAAAETPSPPPAVGHFVKKKFLWPDDDATLTGGAATLPTQLGNGSGQ
jgi:murein L,D-transpeptidase YafK